MPVLLHVSFSSLSLRVSLHCITVSLCPFSHHQKLTAGIQCPDPDDFHNWLSAVDKSGLPEKFKAWSEVEEEHWTTWEFTAG